MDILIAGRLQENMIKENCLFIEQIIYGSLSNAINDRKSKLDIKHIAAQLTT